MNNLLQKPNINAAVIVAHPDDESLWCGGLILKYPHWRWTIVALCRASDPDRAPRFARALRALHARGAMADLDDGPEQTPLVHERTKDTIARLLPQAKWDLLLTHGPTGEYTRHQRHEECCNAVVDLWGDGILECSHLWMFAYEDGAGAYLPCAKANADWIYPLSTELWQQKRNLITDIYGFQERSWETRACPSVEAFFCFQEPQQASQFVQSMQAIP